MERSSTTNAGRPTLKGTIWPFIVVITIQMLFAGASLYTLAAIRSGTVGESLWSKGQHSAVYFLSLYVESGDERDFQSYKTAVRAPLLAHEALLSMEAAAPDGEAAKRFLIDSGSRPTEAAGIVWLLTYFRGVPPFEIAIDLWIRADADILKLDRFAEHIHAERRWEASAADRLTTLRQIEAIDAEITPHAVAFSWALGEGARLVEYSLMVANLAIALVLAALTVWRVRRFLEQRKLVEQELAWQASHDPLTGIPNRRGFEKALVAAIGVGRPAPCALIYLDLDQFKIVNDTCGHAAGDALLRQVGTLLQSRMGARHILARLGGDEFSVLLPGCPVDEALRFAEVFRAAIEAFSFNWEGRAFNITLSVGLVHTDDGLLLPGELMRAADMACFMAKEKGRNRVHYHRQEDQDLIRHAGEMQWVQRIRDALHEDRFCLFAQDIALLSGRREGRHLEILIRLRDEAGHIIPPSAFLPAAERFGLMTHIDRWVVKATFRILAARLRDADADPIACCAINLSGATIGDRAFLGFLEQAFAEFSIPPSMICFEITETCAVTNLDAARSFVEALRALGCRFSLDDFGSGMCSFGYLKHLPVDYVKIDGGFVKNLLNDPVDRAMVEMINHIGHVMGKRIIAEYVENAALVAALSDMGVDYGQGYGIAKPKPFDQGSRPVEAAAEVPHTRAA